MLTLRDVILRFIFRITMMCTGLKTAEITVFISLFVSTREKANATVVKFKRNKVCLKGKKAF